MTTQIEFSLPPYPAGFHLVTDDIFKRLPQLPDAGVVNIFIKHTSAGLTINENADYTVRTDFQKFISKLIPFSSYFEHTLEGDDDMTAHIKSSIIGQSLTIPITNGRLNLGTWQGIYLCEFRDNGGSRKIVVSVVE
jgi:secondary thiamine-phosphate synthase enzyme